MCKSKESDNSLKEVIAQIYLRVRVPATAMERRSEGSERRSSGLTPHLPWVEELLAEKPQEKGMGNLPLAPDKDRPIDFKDPQQLKPKVKTNTDSKMVAGM